MRPNPDDMLKKVNVEEARSRRGRLKIFFGYAAGVGKTYAMLQAAHREREQGVDVVVGYVEPHVRPETAQLLQGFEVLPPKLVPYHGITLREFDLDAALARHPQLILVDELAHTNPCENGDGKPSMRHAKRYQDVQELLEAGIDVYSTLNVQHLESLNDVIAEITGIVVRETIPDAALERADEIELVDVTPEELMERLKEGKIYIPQQAERALQNFFQKSNLLALRELSLRQAAHRLRQDVDAARQEKAVRQPWATSERLLVCVGPSPTTNKLIRTAKRMAVAFGADWLAVAVQTSGDDDANAPARAKIARHLRLAEQLGAETHFLVGDEVAQTILEFARARNVTKLIVGKTAEPWWKRLLWRTVVDRLLEHSGDIDVYVIRGEQEQHASPPEPRRPTPISWTSYSGTVLVLTACGLIGWLMHHIDAGEANVAMVFLLGVAIVSARFGRGPAIVASMVGVLVFDFFFVPPLFSFTVYDSRYVFTFAVMLGIGLLIAELTARMRGQLRTVQLQERHTAALYRFTKQLSEIAGIDFLLRIAGQQLGEIFDAEILIFLWEDRDLALRFGEKTTIAQVPVNAVVARWVADHDSPAGAGTDTLPNATALFLPLTGSQKTIGAVGIKPRDPGRLLDPEQRRLLDTCSSMIALSIERDQSVLEAHEARLRIEVEQLRSSLLSAVSHDLRTPLAVISGASSGLLHGSLGQDENARRELLQTIVDESKRLSRLVDNLLDMTRLESGVIAPNKQWHVLEEIVGSALRRLREEMDGHRIQVNIPHDLPLISIDGVLIEQAIFDLLENAVRYTPPGSVIEISARLVKRRVEIRVADSGPGLPPGTESRVFDKFFRGAVSTADGRRGAGLGLAICRAIVQAHNGTITAHNRPGGGAEFIIALPCQETAPRVTLDEV